MEKIGRNDQCWCGSGHKYKKCHLDRDKKKPPSIQDIIMQGKFMQKELCLHPLASPTECSGQIVKAHTIQRNGGLSCIADQGHVFTAIPTFADLIKSDGKQVVSLTGVRQATTFTGFCSKHDTEIFRPIETGPFQTSDQTAFLLGYRAVSKELYAKMFHLESVKYLREFDKGAPPAVQRDHQKFVNDYSRSVEFGLKDIKFYKDEYDKCLLANDYSRTRFAVITLSQVPEVLCSGGQFPEYDCRGNQLQGSKAFADAGRTLTHITFSMLPTDYGGAAVFSWIDHDPICSQLVNSFLEDANLPNLLFRYAFECFENVAISPLWWSRLDEIVREQCIKRMNHTLHESNMLFDDGIAYTSAEVLGIVRNY